MEAKKGPILYKVLRVGLIEKASKERHKGSKLTGYEDT